MHFVIDSAQAARLRQDWVRANTGVVLDLVDCPDRRLAKAAAEMVQAEAQLPGVGVTAVLPRRSYTPLLGRLLHDRTADRIASVVSQIPNAVATIVPFDVRRRVESLAARARAKEAAAERAAAASSGAGPVGTDQAGTDQAGPEKAGPEKAGPEKAGPEKAGPEEPGPEKAGTEKAGTEKAGTEEPGPGKAGTVHAGTVQAGTGHGPATTRAARHRPQPTSPAAPRARNPARIRPTVEPALGAPTPPEPPASAPDEVSDISRYNRPKPSKAATPIGQLPARGKASVEGRVHAVEIRPVERNSVLACEIVDSTGQLTALFYGRSHIPGLDPGAKVRFTGQVGTRGTDAVMINPAYELLAPGEDDSPLS